MPKDTPGRVIEFPILLVVARGSVLKLPADRQNLAKLIKAAGIKLE